MFPRGLGKPINWHGLTSRRPGRNHPPAARPTADDTRQVRPFVHSHKSAACDMRIVWKHRYVNPRHEWDQDRYTHDTVRIRTDSSISSTSNGQPRDHPKNQNEGQPLLICTGTINNLTNQRGMTLSSLISHALCLNSACTNFVPFGVNLESR